MLRRLALLTALLAPTASAQPSGADLLAAWQAGWDEAVEGVEAVRLAETLRRTVDGPRGTLDIETDGELLLAPFRRPRRTVDRATVNGEDLDLDRLKGMERRLRGALGRAAFDLRRPAALPSWDFAHAAPDGPVGSDRLGSALAWRLPLRGAGRPGRLTAWFSRSRSAPRLLRLDRAQPIPGGGTLYRSTTYALTVGLDVPTSHSVRAQIEQRRRLRTYTLTLRADAQYRLAEVER